MNESSLQASTFHDPDTSNVGKNAGGDRRDRGEARYNTPGYVDGASIPYRGRNMESFCRQADDTKFDPE